MTHHTRLGIEALSRHPNYARSHRSDDKRVHNNGRPLGTHQDDIWQKIVTTQIAENRGYSRTRMARSVVAKIGSTVPVI